MKIYMVSSPDGGTKYFGNKREAAHTRMLDCYHRQQQIKEDGCGEYPPKLEDYLESNCNIIVSKKGFLDFLNNHCSA